ncbi:MAG: SRPBCC domain-containing protein [Candidatus Eiseniibacteriota bacterium]
MDAKHIVEVQVRAAPLEIWNAITRPELTRRYFYGASFEGRLEPGASYLYRLPDGTEGVKGRLLEVDPPARLVMTFEMAFHPQARLDPPSRLTWVIEPLGETCSLRLVHDSLAVESATYRESRNWNPVLAGLKALLESPRAADVRP